MLDWGKLHVCHQEVSVACWMLCLGLIHVGPAKEQFQSLSCWQKDECKSPGLCCVRTAGTTERDVKFANVGSAEPDPGEPFLGGREHIGSCVPDGFSPSY